MAALERVGLTSLDGLAWSVPLVIAIPQGVAGAGAVLGVLAFPLGREADRHYQKEGAG